MQNKYTAYAAWDGGVQTELPTGLLHPDLPLGSIIAASAEEALEIATALLEAESTDRYDGDLESIWIEDADGEVAERTTVEAA